MHGNNEPVEWSIVADAVTNWCCRCAVSVTGRQCGYAITSDVGRVAECQHDIVATDTIDAASITWRLLLPCIRVWTISKTMFMMMMMMMKMNRLVIVSVTIATIHRQCVSLRVRLIGISSTALWNSSTLASLHSACVTVNGLPTLLTYNQPPSSTQPVISAMSTNKNWAEFPFVFDNEIQGLFENF